MIGPPALAHPELVKRVVADGHRLCDHTVSHNTAMDRRSRAYQRNRSSAPPRSAGVGRRQAALLPGARGCLHAVQPSDRGGGRDAPAGLECGLQGLREARGLEDLHVVKDGLGNGPTILFHDGGGDRSETVAALRQMLPWLRHHGYSFSFPVR